jgi:hypothetical protein
MQSLHAHTLQLVVQGLMVMEETLRRDRACKTGQPSRRAPPTDQKQESGCKSAIGGQALIHIVAKEPSREGSSHCVEWAW